MSNTYLLPKSFAKLKLLILKFDGSDALAAFLVHSLKEKLGIEVTAKVYASDEFHKTVKSGGADLFVAHWGADFPDAVNYLDIFQGGSGTISTGWKNAQFDSLLKEASLMRDKSKRQSLLSRAEQLLVLNEVVIYPLFYRKNAVLLGPKIKEFKISPLNYLFFKELTLK